MRPTTSTVVNEGGMEYTDYYVAKGPADGVLAKVKKVSKRGVIMDDVDKVFVPFVIDGKQDKLVKAFDWLLRVFDAEGSAWGFHLWIAGKEIASATYGENAEWGIEEDDNGFEGDEAKTAAALGTTAAKLKKTFDDKGVEKFCKLVGFTHQYMLYARPEEMPKSVKLWSELEEEMD